MVDLKNLENLSANHTFSSVEIHQSVAIISHLILLPDSLVS